MARRRRPGSHTSVVDGRARITVPLETVTDADDAALTIAGAAKWFRRVDSSTSPAPEARAGVAIVLDRFAWDLHLADLAHATDTHDGDTFFEAAVSVGTIDVYIAVGIDPRRSSAEDLDTAGRAGNLLGGSVCAYPVDVLQS